LLADGLGDKAIAAALGISRRTASQHVAAILTKLGAETRTAAVSHALRQGLLGISSPQSS
jgi:DNA-binding NarL/FixJ family response regulator